MASARENNVKRNFCFLAGIVQSIKGMAVKSRKGMGALECCVVLWCRRSARVWLDREKWSGWSSGSGGSGEGGWWAGEVGLGEASIGCSQD